MEKKKKEAVLFFFLLVSRPYCRRQILYRNGDLSGPVNGVLAPGVISSALSFFSFFLLSGKKEEKVENVISEMQITEWQTMK